MASNLEKYKKDLGRLIGDGKQLLCAMYYECKSKQVESLYKKEDIGKFREQLPSFKGKYQDWYSESLAVIKFLLPDRLEDFTKLYEKPRGRKSLGYDNYVVEDYLQGLHVTHGLEKVVGPDAAIPQFMQQLKILESAQKRFESSLFDIKQLLQADLFDSELEAAEELNKKGFSRGAGAVAGVVLETHLLQACKNHEIKILKKDPVISDLNDILKSGNVIEISTWRFIQHLGDLRNKCDHKKKADPKKEEVAELIEGVGKITKSVF